MSHRSPDIVERLRKASVYEEYKAVLSNLGDEAADEIERLRAELEKAGDLIIQQAELFIEAIERNKLRP